MPPRPPGRLRVMGDTDVAPEDEFAPVGAAGGTECPACPPAPDIIADGLWPPGSAQWCSDINGVIGKVEKIGQIVLDAIQTCSAADDVIAALITGFQQAEQAGVAGILVPTTLIVDILQGIRPYADRVSAFIGCLISYYKSLFARNSPVALAACVGLRLALSLLENVEFGTNSIVQLSFSLREPVREAMTALQRIIDYLLPMDLIDIGSATEAWKLTYISDSQYRCILRLNGQDDASYLPYARASGERLSTTEAIEYARRTSGDVPAQLRAMREVGWVDDARAKIRLQLYDRLPGLQDYLSRTRSNLYSVPWLTKWEPDREFEERYWPIYREALEAQGITKENAKYAYMLSWTRTDASMLREFLYRLRPDRVGDVHAFGLADYTAQLTALGYHPEIVSALTATAYRLPPIGTSTQLYYRGLLSDAQLQQSYMDHGYTPADAISMVTLERQARFNRRSAESGGWTPQAIGQAAAIGVIDNATATQLMAALGWSAVETTATLQRATTQLSVRVQTRARARLLSQTVTTVRQGIQTGILTDSSAVASLVALGWTQQQATGIVQLEHTAIKAALVKSIIARLKAAYLAGQVTIQYIESELARLQLTPQSIQQYVQTWQLSLTPGRRRRGATQIQADLASGLIDSATAAAMLANLGYTSTDIALYESNARAATVYSEAALQSARRLLPRSSTAAMYQLSKQSLGLSKKMIAALRQQEPDSKLLSWACNGVVSLEYVIDRLRLYGWDEDSISRSLKGYTTSPTKPPCFTAADVDAAFQSTYQDTGNDTTTYQSGGAPAPTNGAGAS